MTVTYTEQAVADIVQAISYLTRRIRIYYQRHSEELLIVRIYHQARRPITRP